MVEDKRNKIDFDASLVSFVPEFQKRFENGIYVGKLMLDIWNRVVIKAKKNLSPRSATLHYPPLDPNMGKFKDQDVYKVK